MDTVWILLGTACLVYYLLLASVKMDFAAIWLALGALLLSFGLFGPLLPEWGRQIILAVMGAGALCFFVVEIRIASKMKADESKDLDCLILLGAQVKGEVPSRALWKRIQRALAYLKAHPKTVAILSGGRGPGEDVTEAEAMRRCLAKGGIPEWRLILEERSTSTLENLKFSQKLLWDKTCSVGILTSNFHVYRALRLAGKLGYQRPVGISAPCEPRYLPHYLMREFFALIKERLVGNL